MNIEELEEAYCIASVALTEFRKSNGFNPGARVVAIHLDGKEVGGAIPEYGPKWYGNGGLHVPVELDTGILQPWPMSKLRLERTGAAASIPVIA